MRDIPYRLHRLRPQNTIHLNLQGSLEKSGGPSNSLIDGTVEHSQIKAPRQLVAFASLPKPHMVDRLSIPMRHNLQVFSVHNPIAVEVFTDRLQKPKADAPPGQTSRIFFVRRPVSLPTPNDCEALVKVVFHVMRRPQSRR